MARDVQRYPDKAAVGQAAAGWFESEAAQNPGRVAICLTGGSTADILYGRLAELPLPWDRIHLFWSDERFVPPGDPRNNAGVAQRLLIDRVPIPPAHIHPMPTDSANPGEGAARYEAELKRFYGNDALDPARPLFDIVLNGMGADGHTASLFPGQPTLEERARWCIAAEPKLDPFVPRMTLTFPVLESCRASAFLVTGESKVDMLDRVLQGEDLPAARLKPLGSLTWFVDKAARP
jgi:6-phosphogluconolactonase